jgi:hypothetical protein
MLLLSNFAYLDEFREVRGSAYYHSNYIPLTDVIIQLLMANGESH